MSQALPRSAQRIQAALAASGTVLEVVALPASTRTAVEAAAALGCSVAQIAKSILFRTVAEQTPVLVVASGANRVNERAVAAIIGEPIEKADAAYVRAITGFAIGGVPPLGAREPVRTLIDEDLLSLGEVWAAAGTPNTVFELPATLLPELTGGTVCAVK